MATKQNTTKKGLSTGTIIGIGAGVVAAAAATYFFFGPEGKKNRGKLKGWMIRMKGEIIEKMENAKELSEQTYQKIVDAVAARYEKQGISKEAVVGFAEMLKRQWKGFAKKHAPAKKAPAKKKTAKSAPKKS